MARNIFANITARGTLSQFKEAQRVVPQIWPQLTQQIDSKSPDERHVWLGVLPQPREFVSGRSFQGFRDFTYTVANNEYELSYIIDQNTVEDDQHSLIDQRHRDAAKLWLMFKDQQVADLLNNGATSGNNSYDGVTFFNDAHVIGATTFDNTIANTAVDATKPTTAEMKVIASDLNVQIQGAQDDQAQEGYNWPSLGKTIFLGSQLYERAFKEVINATLTGGGDSNPFFGGLGEVMISPFLGTTNERVYIAAVGDPDRMPLIYQERTKLDIQVLNSAEQFALNHGVLVLLRQRYRLTYGEPRRMVRSVLSDS